MYKQREEIAKKIYDDFYLNAPSGLMAIKSCNCNQGRIEKGATAPYSAPCPTCRGDGTITRALTVKEALEFARNAAANMTFTNEQGESVEVAE